MMTDRKIILIVLKNTFKGIAFANLIIAGFDFCIDKPHYAGAYLIACGISLIISHTAEVFLQ